MSRSLASQPPRTSAVVPQVEPNTDATREEPRQRTGPLQELHSNGARYLPKDCRSRQRFVEKPAQHWQPARLLTCLHPPCINSPSRLGRHGPQVWAALRPRSVKKAGAQRWHAPTEHGNMLPPGTYAQDAGPTCQQCRGEVRGARQRPCTFCNSPGTIMQKAAGLRMP